MLRSSNGPSSRLASITLQGQCCTACSGTVVSCDRPACLTRPGGKCVFELDRVEWALDENLVFLPRRGLLFEPWAT